MIQNSYVFVNKYLEDDGSVTGYYNFTGCSEYPAHYHRFMEYTSLGFFCMTAPFSGTIKSYLTKLFGKGYTIKQYMMDSLKFTYDIVEPLNVDKDKPFFELFTLGQLKADRETRSSIRNKSWDLKFNASGVEALGLGGDSAFPFIALVDEDVIGLKTNCYNIRKMAKAATSDDTRADVKAICRKVQIGHTIMRLAYNEGYMIMIFALALHKKHGIDPFYALQMAYHMRYSYSTSGSGYGDIYSPNSGFCSKESFKSRFMNKDYNGSVMNHFVKDEHPMAKYLQISSIIPSSGSITSKIMGIKNLCCDEIIKGLNDPETKSKVDSYIDDCIASCGMKLNTFKFKFVRKLFSATCVEVQYDGILIPNSKLKRIIFKDDNESVLSVLSGSKFIQIK